MSTADELIFDAWTPLTFKRQMGSRSVTGDAIGFNPAPWIGEEHYRRLTAYAILRAYQDNAAREFMVSADRVDIDNRREYGEPALLVNTVLGALLGEDQTIHTDGAEETTDKGKPTAEASSAIELQDWFDDWADDERLALKMIECERRSVGLGDGVYTLGWSGVKGRPRLRVWDPAFYFPVLNDANEDDYPDKVHIAWEYPDDDGTVPAGKTKIRRITWELGPIAPESSPGAVGRVLGRETKPLNGDTLAEDGSILRSYEWNDKPSSVTCFLTDATFVIDRASKSINDLSLDSAVYATDSDGEVNRRDLMIDFVPVVHVPNTVSIIEHYGRSVIATVLQLLDDLASADTDLSAAAATTGHPVIALNKGTVEKDGEGNAKVTYRPGEILESGEGTLSVLDTSKSLEALIGYIEFLLKRLSVNSRVAESLLGRVKASEVPSGVALALSFGPTEQLVKEMRLVRAEKYPLLLKFVQRLAIAGGDPDVPKEWLHTTVEMGSFLPRDKAEAVDLVTKLLGASGSTPAISLETAVLELIKAGFEIEDAYAEVKRIESRDFAGAGELVTALGSKELAAAYLGRELPKDENPPPNPPPPTDPNTGLPSGVDPTKFGPDGQPLDPAPAPAPAPVPPGQNGS